MNQFFLQYLPYLPSALAYLTVFSAALYYVAEGPVSWRRADYAVNLSLPLPCWVSSPRIYRLNRIRADAAAIAVLTLAAYALAARILPQSWLLPAAIAAKLVFWSPVAFLIGRSAWRKIRATRFADGAADDVRRNWLGFLLAAGVLGLGFLAIR